MRVRPTVHTHHEHGVDVGGICILADKQMSADTGQPSWPGMHGS